MTDPVSAVGLFIIIYNVVMQVNVDKFNFFIIIMFKKFFYYYNV